MFGDFDADMNGLALAGYSRKLTGVKLHLEDKGEALSPSRARVPARLSRVTLIPGGSLSLAQLSYGEILADRRASRSRSATGVSGNRSLE